MELSVQEVVAGHVKKLRAQGATQEDIANAARWVGLSWGRSTVSNLEAGTKALGAEELLLLPYVLRLAWPNRLVKSIGDLLTPPDGHTVRISATCVIDSDGIGRLLAGKARPDELTLEVESTWDPYEARQDWLLELTTGFWPECSNPDAIVRLVGEPEQKAAPRLGIPPEGVALLAARLWGRSLGHERDKRLKEAGRFDASPRTLQARRGAMTKVLLNELLEYLIDSQDPTTTAEAVNEKKEASRGIRP